MKISELMEQLSELFPAHLSSQSAIDAWAKQMKMVLSEGPNLQQAFENTMADWRKTTPPRPADIKDHWPAAPKDDEDRGSYWSQAQVDRYVAENIEEKTADIWEAGIEMIGRCKHCTSHDPGDCRCEGWQLSREKANIWLQRECHIERGRARINLYPDRLTDGDLRAVKIARTAPPLKAGRLGLEPIRGYVRDSARLENK